MDRIAVTAILIVLLGIWVTPFIRGAGGPEAAIARDSVATPVSANVAETAPNTSRDAAARVAAALIPSTSAPAPDAYKVLRGTKGFWRVGQTNAGEWWFISPTGEREFLNTVDTVQPYQSSRDKYGARYVSSDWTGSLSTETRNDPHINNWAQKTVQRLRTIGFKGIGAWSNAALHNYDMPMSQDLNIWAWQKGDSRRFYSPQWAATAELAVKVQTEPLRENRNLVGYFIDNELDWGDGGSGPTYYFNDLPHEDPNRAQVINVIQSVWTTIDGFNRDWDTKITDWKDINEWNELPRNHPHPYGRLFSAWLSHLSADYFKTTTTLIRKYDPNHLILGVRFKGYAPLEVVRACKGLTDVVSLNYYVGDARLDLEMFRMMSEESAQPVMISEYSFHSLDGRSGNRNTVGFAAQVLDQQARADGYNLLTTRLARVPYVIGADWFQWSDEPPGGRFGDGEDVNFGIVDVDDHAYELLAKSIAATTPQLNPLHAESMQDDKKDVWRESFATKPVVNVPYLTTPIELNGELSDWPAQCKVQGMRHSQTIGLERSKLPLPNVYLGWTDEGLYLGFEVFDDDIQGAPPKGWWWTRDYVEFWVSTRPVASDQNNYDQYDHQFFFVPNDFPGEDGVAGVAGQWHRAGDALTVDSLIPHPDIRQAARILPDRYVVEMLIPAKALNGWDPRKEPAMAFNFHVRNWQHAIDYFWSAPKEVMTQLRPNTWGNMYMVPPGGGSTAQAKAF